MSESEPALPRFDESPKRIQGWIDSLPWANLGSSTRQLLRLLKESNRATLTPKQRQQLLEAIRPRARYVLGNLSRYFESPSYPMPPKTRWVIDICDTLLIELSRGYLQIAEALDHGRRFPKEMMCQALFRATFMASDHLLLAMHIYTLPRAEGWRWIHTAFTLGHKHRLANITIRGEEGEPHASVAELYLRLLLLLFMQPYGMAQGDARRVYPLLLPWTRFARLSTSRPDSEHFFAFDPNAELPIDLRERSGGGRVLYFLDIEPLLIELTVRRDNSAPPAEISAASLRWRRASRRRFQRSAATGRARVALGLLSISHCIRRAERDAEAAAAAELQGESTNLMGFETNLISSSSSEVDDRPLGFTEWGASEGAVPEGSMISNASDHGENPCSEWNILNISAGGSALQWEQKQGTFVHVGDPLALSLPNSDSWRFGVVRRLQSPDKKSLEVGVEFLAPSTLPAQIRWQDNGGWRADALYLPAVPLLNEPARLVLPAREELDSGAQLDVKLALESFRVVLTDLIEGSDQFRLFHFSPVTQATLGAAPDSGLLGAGFWDGL